MKWSGIVVWLLLCGVSDCVSCYSEFCVWWCVCVSVLYVLVCVCISGILLV